MTEQEACLDPKSLALEPASNDGYVLHWLVAGGVPALVSNPRRG
jgi:hypothetical protein